MIPVFGISIPFIFVLLILLLTKTPKLGVWVVGGLIMAVVFGLLILMPFPGGDVAPLFGISVPFLFVLLILLLNKAPKVGGGVIVGVVVMGLLGTVLWLGASHPRVARERSIVSPVRIRRQRVSIESQSVAERSWAQESFAQTTSPSAERVLPPPVTAAIWSEGVENEYEADIYPSKLAAVRALARRMRKPIEQVIADMNTPTKIVLFQNENDGSLAAPFKQAIAETLPDIPCSVLYGSRNIDADEIGITLQFRYEPVLGQVRPQLLASARHRDWEATMVQEYIEKPWAENFSAYASERPQEQFVVARSRETCTSENEAKHQAIRDACDQVSAVVGEQWPTVPGRSPLTVSSTDLLEGGFILDQFVQSFDGLSGRFWRQAMLIDTSAEKLNWLASRKTAEVHVVRTTWAHMILSALGVLVVIVATYLFLNMATRGYYVWSLRIAGVVLAVMGIVSILLVLK